MKLQLKTILLPLLILATSSGASAQVSSCMDFNLYEETRDSRRINELALMNESLLALETMPGKQCMAASSLQCVDYDIKVDATLFNNSQDTANEIISLLEQREINKICTTKLLLAKELQAKGGVPEDERLNEQIFPYICTLATMLEDITGLFENKDGLERSKVDLENQIANLNAEIKKKETEIELHEQKINEIADRIGTPSKVEENGDITEAGSGLLGDLGKGQSELIKSEKAYDECKQQNVDAAAAHTESGSEEEFTPPCDEDAALDRLVKAKVDLRQVAISLIETMIELTGAETGTIISLLKGTIYGQVNVDGTQKNVAFQVNGQSFQLVNIAEAVTSNFGIPLDQAAAFDPSSDTVKELSRDNPAIKFLVDLVVNLGDDTPGNPNFNIDRINYKYGVGCSNASMAAGGCKQESRSNMNVDPEYGYDYSDILNKQTKDVLTGLMDLTGNEIADTSNLGAIAYAASIQAQSGRQDRIGTKENPEQGSVWAAIKKDQDEITRLETGDTSLRTTALAIEETTALLRDRICVMNALLGVYKKYYDGLELKEHIQTERIMNALLEQEGLGFTETIVGVTKYLHTYVYKWSTSNLEKYSSSGYLGNYSGPTPREIASEFVCVIRTDDVIGCQEKYSAISTKRQEEQSCIYTGTMAGPAPPMGYPEKCTKAEEGKTKQFDWYTFSCSCNY